MKWRRLLAFILSGFFVLSVLSGCGNEASNDPNSHLEKSGREKVTVAFWGDQLTEGALSPHEVLRIRGLSDCHNYLIREVQKVYRQQGVDTNDKHIEVIVSQMMRKVRVEEAGDSDLLSGSTVEITEFWDAEQAVRDRIAAGEKNELGEDLVLPTCTRVLMGITKASLATESFLSAASFQETTKVLTEAAIKGKVDHLLGLKENVIIGKLIPAGSGLAQYRQEDVIDDEGNLIAQARRRPEREVDLDFSVDEDDDESDDEGDDLFTEVGPLELEPAPSESHPQEAEV